MLAALSNEYSSLVLWHVKSKVTACNSVAVLCSGVATGGNYPVYSFDLNALLLSDVLSCFISITMIKIS